MKEELTAGGREFLYALLWAAGLYFICGVMMSLFGSYAFIGGIISVIVFCIYGFFILTHYTSRFTYSIKNKRLRINRMIGKRNKEVELNCTDIEGLYYGYKPSDFPKPCQSMRKSIITKKHSLYIAYKNKEGERCGVVIEPSDKLWKKITLLKDKVVNDD